MRLVAEAVPYRAKSKALDDYQLGVLNPTFACKLPWSASAELLSASNGR